MPRPEDIRDPLAIDIRFNYSEIEHLPVDDLADLLDAQFDARKRALIAGFTLYGWLNEAKQALLLLQELDRREARGEL